MKQKKGITIVELVVAMGIFIVAITIIIGAFVTVSRMKALTSTMKESQQKTRIALEMMTRLARQAERVIITDSGDTLMLYSDLDGTPTGVRFQVAASKITYSECTTSSSSCPTWGPETNLFEGIAIQNTATANSGFSRGGTIPPTLDVIIYGRIESVNSNPYYSDAMNLDTRIILESIK